MRKRRILSLLLAVAVTVTMLVAVPLTASAADTINYTIQKSHEYAAAKNADDTENVFANDDNITILFNNCAGKTDADSHITNFRTAKIDNKTSGKQNLFAFAASSDSTTGIYIKAKKSGTLSVSFKLANGVTGSKSISIYDNGLTTNNNQTIASYVAGSAAGAETTGTYELKAGTDYLLNQSGSGDIHITSISFTPESTDPDMTLSASELSVFAGSSDTTLTANLVNVQGTNNITWKIQNNEGTGISIKEQLAEGETITIDATNAKAGDTATVTATVQGTSFETAKSKECEVTVIEPVATVSFTGDSKGLCGLTKVTLTPKDGQGEPPVLEIGRTNGAIKSVPKEITGVKFGTYTVTAECATPYYKIDSAIEDLVVDATTETVNIPISRVFDKKELSELTEDKIAGVKTWTFNNKTYDPKNYLNLEGSPITSVYSDDNSVYMNVDTSTGTYYQEGTDTPYKERTGGKFNSHDAADYIQCNSMTQLDIPVIKGSVITIDGLNANGNNKDFTDTGLTTLTKLKVIENGNGTETDLSSGASPFTYTYKGEEKGFVRIVSAGGNLNKITVTSTWMPSYPGWVIGKNNKGAEGAAAVEKTYQGKDKAVEVESFNIYKKLNTPITSGTAVFSTDVYINADAVKAGGGFRVILESAEAENQPADNASGTVQIMHTGDTADKISIGSTTVDFTEAGWYNLKAAVDFGAKTVKVTLTDPKGTKLATDQAVDINGLDKLTQIRLVRRSGPAVFANMVLYGNGSHAAGYYTANDQAATEENLKLGAIRFFQGFEGSDTVTEYGFYFIKAADATIEDSTLKKSKQGKVDPAEYDGLYGDLVGIAAENFKNTYYALPFVKTGAEIVYGNAIEGSVGEEPEWIYNPVTE